MSSFNDTVDLSSSLKAIEQELDHQQERARLNSQGVRLESSSRSAAISIPSQPSRTTVGFGAGSFTQSLSSPRSPNEALSQPVAQTMSSEPSSEKGKSQAAGQAAQQAPASSQAAPQDSNNKKEQGQRDFPKKPKLSKKERREQQERQRAEKAARKAAEAEAKGGASRKSSQKKPKQVASKIVLDDEKKQKSVSKRLARLQVPERQSTQKQVSLFSHLRQYERTHQLTKDITFGANTPIHPEVTKLGLRMSEGRVTGSSERCTMLLLTLRTFIKDYTTPPGKELQRDLGSSLDPQISFLIQCRPLSVSMGNAIKYLKHEIHKIEPSTPEEEAKEYLCDCIDRYIQERIVLAQVAITQYALTKIQDGDVILVHGHSALLIRVFEAAKKRGIDFRVVVVDSRPKCSGKRMLHRLADLHIECTYVLINAISYMMSEVTKVFMSAHALLANGYVMGRIGDAMIGMMAKAYNVPVLLCCETYKFCDRVQTDAFVLNELDDPNDLVSIENTDEAILSDWQQTDKLKLLNLVMDVTPPEFVDMVITELGMLPCSSVPVVLRVKDEHR